MPDKKKKIRVGIIFGGRSGEHEVSLASATSITANLDKDKYEVVPIAITKQGSWLLGVEPPQLLAAEQSSSISPEPGEQHSTAVTLTGDPSLRRLIPVRSDEQLGEQGALDVVFPVLHGTYGEDGALQGLLEMANVPYVGCGVLGSALGMDKEKMKMIFQSAGLPIVDSRTYRRTQWERSPETILEAVEHRIGYPCFVKPVNLGSSVGVNKAHDRDELIHAIDVAAESPVIGEPSVPRAVDDRIRRVVVDARIVQCEALAVVQVPVLPPVAVHFGAKMVGRLSEQIGSAGELNRKRLTNPS